MTTFLFPKDDRNPTAKFMAKKGEQHQLRVDFDDAHVLIEGKVAHCWLWVSSHDAVVMRDKPVDLPQVAYLAINGDSESIAEKVAFAQISVQDFSKGKRGYLTVKDMGLDEATMNTIAGQLFRFDDLTGERPIKDTASLKAPAGKSGGRQFKSPKERLVEKLNLAEEVAKDEKLMGQVNGYLDLLGVLSGKSLTAEEKLTVLQGIF
ncbi:MAG: hypothetical protein AAFW84_09760 [Cyanobacteria bacterium J06635_15]